MVVMASPDAVASARPSMMALRRFVEARAELGRPFGFANWPSPSPPRSWVLFVTMALLLAWYRIAQ
jgi:hypothetical protein